MLKIPAFFLFTIILFIFPAMAQNSNTAANRPRPSKPVSDAGLASNIPPPPPPAASTVRGRVYYEDTGRAVKRTSIMFVTEGGPGEMTALTDGDGNFVVKNVRAGTYYAVVNAPGVVSPIAYVDFANMGPGNGGREKESLNEALVNFDKIIVDGVNEVYVQIPARRGGAISGRVFYENGDPAIGVKVEMLRKVKGKYISVISNLMSVMSMFSGGTGGQTDDRGMYRFSGLPPGDYIVKVSESAQHTDEPESFGPMRGMTSLLFGVGSMLNFYFPDASDAKDAQVINVLLGQEQSEINIAIPDKRLFNLAGKIISQKDKKPLAGAKVSLKKKGQTDSSLFNLIGAEMNIVTADLEGNWRFKELPKGDYTITVQPANKQEYDDDDSTSDYSGAANTARPNAPIKPTFAKSFKDAQLDDKSVEDLVIELGYGATVSGTFSVDNNKDMPQNASIQAFGENDELLSSASVWNYRKGSSANVAVPAPKTRLDFKLENVAAGKVNLKFQLSDDYYIKSARSGMVDLLAAPLDIKEGDLISGIKIVLANDVGTLKGRILDDKDHPVAGVALMLVPTDMARRNSNFYKNVRSDTDGRFEIKLPPGEYAVLFLKPGIMDGEKSLFTAWLDEAMKSPEKASVSADGTTNINLRAPGE